MHHLFKRTMGGEGEPLVGVPPILFMEIEMVIENSGCIIIENEKLLVIYKKKHCHYEFPGGKVEPGESLEKAALRETKEEIGCNVDLLDYIGYIDFHIAGKNIRSHNFLAKIKKGQNPKIGEPEIFRDIFWLPIKEYKKYPVAPNVKIFCKCYLHGKPLPKK